MASDFKISTAARNAACQAFVDLFDDDFITSIRIFPGSPPASIPAQPPLSGQLAVLADSAPQWSTPSNGASTADLDNDGVPQGDVNDTGTAGHFMMVGSSFATICQGTCGDAGDAPVDLQFNSKNLVDGGSLTVSITVTMPE